MQATLHTVDRSWPWSLALAVFVAGVAGACDSSNLGNGQSGITGAEAIKPGGGLFFVDENQSGGAASFHLVDIRYGRLVDIHEIDALGKRVEVPVFTDFVIEPDIGGVSPSYRLDRNPVTQRERLTIRAQKTGVVDTTAFDQLLANASDGLPVVSVKNDDGTSSPPFTMVPRNSCVVLRFDDCLDDDLDAQRDLNSTVQVLSGYPPVTPFVARRIFDPNHGAVVRDAFHSTRVLVDMTTSEAESSSLPVVQDVNSVGLPASRASTPNSLNTSIRVASAADLGVGQFQILRNLSQRPLASTDNGPIDLNSLSRDVVRGFRSGNSGDPSNGFLSDGVAPRILSGWSASVTLASNDPLGEPGFDFLLDFSFNTTCASAPVVGDGLLVGGAFLQATAGAALAGSDVSALAVRSVSFVSNPLTLLGDGQFQTPYTPALAVDGGCWVSFLPEATTFPTTGVSTDAQVVVRFSEPMDPDTLSPFRQFMVVEGAAVATSTAKASNVIVGNTLINGDLTLFSFEPQSPYPHSLNTSETLHLELGANVTDLAGNNLQNQLLPFVNFTIDPQQATQKNGAVVLRFEAADEYAPNDGTTDTFRDLRGQFNYDSLRGLIAPRPVAFSGWPVDNNNPTVMQMFQVAGGVFTPLNPLGAKLQTVWRYADMGWAVRDETKYNLDVVGLNWSPVAGLAVADFYDLFEIQLGHSTFLPDDFCCPAGALGGTSGLPGSPRLFANNYLAGTAPKVVHNKALGYVVNPASLFNATTGTPMIPFPLNRGLAPQVTYTWRDTAILGLGATGDATQPGIPLEAEVAAGVATQSGSLAGPGAVPSIGLPLLIEIRCHPSNQGLGLNLFSVNLANPFFPIPGFRAYSAGGINTLGNPVLVLPDGETFPQGGFNPGANPPGTRTANSADNVFYLGQLDTVVKVSRVHTVWLDAGLGAAPLWQSPIMDPPLTEQPLGTEIRLDFRSATGFAAPTSDPFNADALNVYGNQTAASPLGPVSDWSSNIAIGDGRQYLQVRMTFLNNVATGVTAELEALALPFDIP